MAITNYNFNAADYVRSGSKRVITCSSSSISGNFKYRFYLELIYDSKTYAYTFRPNKDDYGLINIGKILQSIVSPISVQQVLTIPDADASLTTNYFQQNIHSMPHIINDTSDRYAYLSTGGSGCKRIQVKLWDFYSSTANGVPSKQGSAQEDYYYVLTGTELSTDSIRFKWSDYKLTATNTKFLSHNYNALGHTDAALTDYGSVAILNRTDDVNTAANSYKFIVNYYNSSDVLLATQDFINTEDYGGKYDASGVTDDSMIIHFGCYPANLNKLDASYERPSDNPSCTYYEVYIANSGGTRKSSLYRFNIVRRCDKYDSQRFAFINRFGVWEYITFNKKRTDKIRNKKTEIKSSIFDYAKTYATYSGDYAEAPFVPGVAHESRSVKAADISEEFEVSTGYLNTGDIAKVRDMFISPLINYINSDGTALAVILKNDSIDNVVVSHKFEQTEYKLKFEYSIPTYNSIIY